MSQKRIKNVTKSKPGKAFRFDVELYPATVAVYVGRSTDELLNLIDNLKIPDINKESFRSSVFESGRERFESSHANTMYQDDFDVFIITLPFDRIRTAAQHAALAHEIFHVTEHVADLVGLKHVRESSEAYAYLLDHLTECIYEQLLK